MHFVQLVTEYGYWAVLIGAFLEGETIVVMAGFLAARSYLALPWVMLCAFVGSTLGDQLAFAIGLRFGRRLLARRKRLRARAERVTRMVRKHQVPLLLGFRFLYGLRNVTPIALAVSGVRPRVFIPYNVVGAAVWAVLLPLGGYAFGAAFESMLARARHYELLGLLALGGALMIVGLVVRWKTREPVSSDVATIRPPGRRSTRTLDGRPAS